MILANPAARYTYVPINSTAVQIAAGETIRVHGILCSGANTLTIADNDGNTIATVNLSGGVPFEIKTGFIAHKGLKITTNGLTTVTVFHSNASA